jgi:hypothetical protein
MRAHLIVVLARDFDDDLGLSARAEPLHARSLLAQPPVEALVGAVLPRLARVDRGELDVGLGDPLERRAADERRALVRAQVGRGNARRPLTPRLSFLYPKPQVTRPLRRRPG